MREDSGPDWIGFYLPVGALGSVYDVGAFPFVDGKSSRTWREPLDDWLRQIAAAVFTVVPFSLALIGHEVSGTAYADEIRITGVPDERWGGLLWGDSEELIWYPPTRHEGDYTVDRASGLVALPDPIIRIKQNPLSNGEGASL